MQGKILHVSILHENVSMSHNQNNFITIWAQRKAAGANSLTIFIPLDQIYKNFPEAQK